MPGGGGGDGGVAFQRHGVTDIGPAYKKERFDQYEKFLSMRQAERESKTEDWSWSLRGNDPWARGPVVLEINPGLAPKVGENRMIE